MAWSRIDNDATDFESQVVLIRSDGTELELALLPVVFEDEKPASRLVLEMSGLPEFGGQSGTILFEARLRAAGTEEWICRQNYPIMISVLRPDGAIAGN